MFALGNPWPPVIEDPVDTSKWLHNVLLDAMRKDLESEHNDGSSVAVSEENSPNHHNETSL